MIRLNFHRRLNNIRVGDKVRLDDATTAGGRVDLRSVTIKFFMIFFMQNI